MITGTQLVIFIQKILEKKEWIWVYTHTQHSVPFVHIVWLCIIKVYWIYQQPF